MEDNDYMDKVKYQVELGKIFSFVKPENRNQAKALFDKKQEIIKKNGIFADFQLKRINKKIDKLK